MISDKSVNVDFKSRAPELTWFIFKVTYTFIWYISVLRILGNEIYNMHFVYKGKNTIF